MWSFFQVSPPRPCMKLSPICATSPAHLILLDLIILKYKVLFPSFLVFNILKTLNETYAINYKTCANVPAIF